MSLLSPVPRTHSRRSKYGEFCTHPISHSTHDASSVDVQPESDVKLRDQGYRMLSSRLLLLACVAVASVPAATAKFYEKDSVVENLNPMNFQTVRAHPILHMQSIMMACVRDSRLLEQLCVGVQSLRKRTHSLDVPATANHGGYSLA